VPFRIADIGGYASPDLRRNVAYWSNVTTAYNQLLDMANIRYVVYPWFRTSTPSYGGILVDQNNRVMQGGMDSAGGFEAYALGGKTGDSIGIIATLARSVDVPQDAVVLEVTIVPRGIGAPQTFQLRAGRDLSETAYDRADVRAAVRHQKAGVIAFERTDRLFLDGSTYQRLYYYVDRALPAPMEVERIELRYVYPIGGIEVWGMALFNSATGAIESVTPEMRTKLRPVYTDAGVRIFENDAIFPRAYVVPGYRIASNPDSPLASLVESSFDPSTEVLLTERPPDSAPPVTGLPNRDRTTRPHSAEAILIAPDRAAYRVSSSTGGYFVHVANLLPGWRAWVDGREAPLLLANALFRAVPIAPGEHVVELRYEPASVAIGLRVTLLALAIAGIGLAMAAAAGIRARRLALRGEAGPRDVER
jgi:hypothetical protein